MKDAALHEILNNYRQSLEEELFRILDWWVQKMPDEENGGFYGTLNNAGVADTNAPRGVVLYSRILWTFSAAVNQGFGNKYREMADRAYRHLRDQFWDEEHGGVYWSVDRHGDILQGRKQIYGQAFTLYGLSEYWKMNEDEQVLDDAMDIVTYMEYYSRDKQKLGYQEAFERDWNKTGDLRLSEKDDNEAKTMNTHLHVVEAYANLYEAWKPEILKARILELLDLFEQHFIDPATHHLRLFFDEDWNLRSSLISFGHDIEAAWLLLRCAEISGDAIRVERFRNYAVKIAGAADAGWDDQIGGLYYEQEPARDLLVAEKHWWPQAEAMVGYFNAWEISGDKKWLDRSLMSFEFTRKYLVDPERGEWFWGIDKNGNIMDKEKAGFWKCPYHNSRACIEVIRRIDKILSHAD